MSKLRFTPVAWAKLLFLRDAGKTEIGAFGIAGDPDDLLLMTDVITVRQRCCVASNDFDSEAIADFIDDQVDQGRSLEQCSRVWIHTHPGNSAQPSGQDETTFRDVFGRFDWSVMFILANGGAEYGRTQYGIGPRQSVLIDADVEYGGDWPGADRLAWQTEYDANIQPIIHATKFFQNGGGQAAGKKLQGSGYPGINRDFFGAEYDDQYYSLNTYQGDDDNWMFDCDPGQHGQVLATVRAEDRDRLLAFAEANEMSVDDAMDYVVQHDVDLLVVVKLEDVHNV